MHTPNLNGVINIILAFIKEGALAMILNTKLNGTAQKMLCMETIHMYEHIQNSMATTGSTESPFENFYGETLKIIGSF